MPFSISGTCYTDRGVTPMGSGRAVYVSVNGGAPVINANTASDGTFTLSGVSGTAPTVTVFLKGNTEKGVTVLAANGISTNLTGVVIYQNSLVLQRTTGSSLAASGTNLNVGDNSGDSDIAAIYSSSSNTAFTLAAGKNFYPVGTSQGSGGTATMNGGTFDSTLSTITAVGPITFVGGGTLITKGTGQPINGSLTINCLGATVTLRSDIEIGTANALAIQAGTLDVSSSNYGITLDGLGSNPVWNNTGGNFNARAGTVTIGISIGSNAGNILSGGQSFYNLVISGKISVARDVSLLDALVVTNNLTINASAQLDVSSSNYGITIGGTWSNSGTFVQQSGTVTLNGTNQTISGSTTFYNLTKTVAAADTLTFTDGTTQTITNSLTLNGASGQLLTLTGTSTGGWTISCPVTQSLTYVKPDHSTATTNTAAAGTGSVDGGNNTNWSFPSANPFPASYLRIQQFYFLPDVDSSWWSGQRAIKSQLPPIQQPIPILQQQLLLESCDVQQQIRQQPVLVTSLSGSFPRQQLQDSNNWIQPEFSYRTVSSLVAFTIPTQSRPTTVPEYQKENIDWWYEQPRTIIVQASIPSAVLSWSGITQTTMQQSGISSTIIQKVGVTSTSLSWVGRTL